jgi:hypothetical protein
MSATGRVYLRIPYRRVLTTVAVPKRKNGAVPTAGLGRRSMTMLKVSHKFASWNQEKMSPTMLY